MQVDQLDSSLSSVENEPQDLRHIENAEEFCALIKKYPSKTEAFAEMLFDDKDLCHKIIRTFGLGGAKGDVNLLVEVLPKKYYKRVWQLQVIFQSPFAINSAVKDAAMIEELIKILQVKSAISSSSKEKIDTLLSIIDEELQQGTPLSPNLQRLKTAFLECKHRVAPLENLSVFALMKKPDIFQKVTKSTVMKDIIAPLSNRDIAAIMNFKKITPKKIESTLSNRFSVRSACTML